MLRALGSADTKGRRAPHLSEKPVMTGPGERLMTVCAHTDTMWSVEEARAAYYDLGMTRSLAPTLLATPTRIPRLQIPSDLQVPGLLPGLRCTLSRHPWDRNKSRMHETTFITRFLPTVGRIRLFPTRGARKTTVVSTTAAPPVPTQDRASVQGTPGSSVASKHLRPPGSPWFTPSLATDRLLESLTRSPPADLFSPDAACRREAAQSPLAQGPATFVDASRQGPESSDPEFSFPGANHTIAGDPAARPTRLGSGNQPDPNPFPARRGSFCSASASGFGSVLSVGTAIPSLVAGSSSHGRSPPSIPPLFVGSPSPLVPQTPATPTSQPTGAGARPRAPSCASADKENLDDADGPRTRRPRAPVAKGNALGQRSLRKGGAGMANGPSASEGAGAKGGRQSAREGRTPSPVRERERAPTPERPAPEPLDPPPAPSAVEALTRANASLKAQLMGTLEMVRDLCEALGALYNDGQRMLREAGAPPGAP